MSQTTPLPTVDIPPEVYAYAREMQVEPYLPVVLELAHRHFPQATLTVFLDDDPEADNLRFIVVRAWGGKMTVDEGVQAIHGFTRDTFAHIPAPLVWVFRLSTRIEG